MKCRYFVFLAMVLGLIGCSNGEPGGTSGWLDCYSIRVTEGGNTILSETYYESYSLVYEYKSVDGRKIYASASFSTIRAYPNRHTDEYTDYLFSRFVGFLTLEENYYLDLGTRTIDSETKWSQYKYAQDPATLSDVKSDNIEAYRCAQSCYYYININYTNELRLYSMDSSLERHTYTMLGEDSVITYKAKWF